MKNGISFDLEDWFQVLSFRWFDKEIEPSNQLKKNVHALLSLLLKKKTKATFFVLGKLIEHQSDLIKDIFDEGHEIAFHGYSHKLLAELDREKFRGELKLCQHLFERLGIKYTLGYRAPAFTITKFTEWAVEVLAEEGFIYDSSIFPIRHPVYGAPNAPKIPFILKAGTEDTIWELPISTYRLFGFTIPFGGGGYSRILPYFIVKKFLKKLNDNNIPGIFYFHPYELSPETSSLSCRGLFIKFKYEAYKCWQNMGRKTTYRKIENLLSDFEFSSFGDLLHEAKLKPNTEIFSFQGI